MKLDASLEARIGAEQIEALFAAVNVTVCGGAAAAAALVASLHRLGAVDTRSGIFWVLFIAGCAVGHMLLCLAYRRASPVGDGWRAWGRWFTVFSFAEGLGWGWAPIWLVGAGHSSVKHFVFLIVGGVCAATIPGFSPFLPAFVAIFVPAACGALIGSIASQDPIQQAAFPLMLVFTAVMAPLGFRANRSFRQLVGLRVQTERLAEDLREQKEIAERANLAKSTFLAAASHDLRQPVQALVLFVAALRRVPMSADGRRLIEQIEASTSAMDSLFTTLLDISRLDAGIVDVQRRAFAVGPMIERICLDHQTEASAKGVVIRAKPSTAVVESDPILAERILRNLVSNAVRNTEDGRVVVGCRTSGPTVSVQVWDTGIGIPPEQQDRIFEEYYQLGNPERDRTKGLGLGLAIVRRLADLLGSEVRLRSTPGRGSCFAIAFPVASSQAESEPNEQQHVSSAFARALIVVVDDEAAIREAMSSVLLGWGYDVITAGSGDEAMRNASRCPEKPDLIICDYRLRDGENGIEVVARIRADYNEPIAAVLITGDTAPTRLAEAQTADLLLLHKPVSNIKLRAAIVHSLAGSEARETAQGAQSSPVR